MDIEIVSQGTRRSASTAMQKPQDPELQKKFQNDLKKRIELESKLKLKSHSSSEHSLLEVAREASSGSSEEIKDLVGFVVAPTSADKTKKAPANR